MKYPHLASRLFGAPLLIERQKLEVILGAVAPRLGLSVQPNEAQLLEGESDRLKRKSYEVTDDGIAVINIVGPLVKRSSGDFMSGGPTSYAEVEHEIVDAATDPLVQGLLLIVDSPGGESTGCFELSDLIHSLRGSKPMIAAVDGDAFSAAYALASAADSVILTKSGGVGSIGVWMMHVDWSAANEKAGVKPTYLYAGARKIDGNPDQPLAEEAAKVFQSEVDRIYGMFVETVARNRSMTVQAVQGTEAALMFGEAGVTSGLADRLGTVSDALAELRARLAQPSSSAAAVSAENPKQRKNMLKRVNGKASADAAPDKTDPADEPKTGVVCPGCDGTGKVDGAECPECKGTGEVPEPSEDPLPEASAARAIGIVEMCALAGFSAEQSLKFLRSSASIESIRREIVDARAAGGPRINSHILPEAGTENKSPLVAAAERAAATAKGGN